MLGKEDLTISVNDHWGNNENFVGLVRCPSGASVVMRNEELWVLSRREDGEVGVLYLIPIREWSSVSGLSRGDYPIMCC